MKVFTVLLIGSTLALWGTTRGEEPKTLKEVDLEAWQFWQNFKESDGEAWYRDRALSSNIAKATSKGELVEAMQALALWSAAKLAAEGEKEPPRLHVQEMHLRNLGNLSKAYFLIKDGSLSTKPPQIPPGTANRASFTQGYYDGLFDTLIGHDKLISGVGMESFFEGRKLGQAIASKALAAGKNKPAEQDGGGKGE